MIGHQGSPIKTRQIRRRAPWARSLSAHGTSRTRRRVSGQG